MVFAKSVLAKSVDSFSALWHSLNAKGANEAKLHEKIKNSRFRSFRGIRVKDFLTLQKPCSMGTCPCCFYFKSDKIILCYPAYILVL